MGPIAEPLSNEAVQLCGIVMGPPPALDGDVDVVRGEDVFAGDLDDDAIAHEL